MTLDDLWAQLEAIRLLLCVCAIALPLQNGLTIWRIIQQAKNERDFS